MSTLNRRRISALPRDTAVRSPAQTRTFDGTRPEAILLIHGFTGTVHEMEYLGRRLAEAGFPVTIPRLPGHGTNHQDFLSVTWKDWLRRCVDEYLELAAHHDRVYVVGLSMGGLLAVLLAGMFPIERLTLAAPALATVSPFVRLAPLVRFLLRSVRDPRELSETESDPDLKYLEEEYKYHHWVGPIAELRLLQRVARARLRLIEADTLTIVSRADNTVPYTVADLVDRRIGAQVKQRMLLEKSHHVVVDGIEREAVADAIVSWFSRPR